jgi:hypothetical protein
MSCDQEEDEEFLSMAERPNEQIPIPHKMSTLQPKAFFKKSSKLNENQPPKTTLNNQPDSNIEQTITKPKNVENIENPTPETNPVSFTNIEESTKTKPK